MKKSFYLILILFLLPGCLIQREIKIGFIGTLMDKSSKFSIDGRNGVMFAAYEINKEGGILGRKIKIIVKNDDNQIIKANSVIDDFRDKEKVFAIIGPMTSNIGHGVIKNINKSQIICISPTCSSFELKNSDDYFFTLGINNQKAATRTEERIKKDFLPGEKLAIFYQLDNKNYVTVYLDKFLSLAEKDNIAPIIKVPFSNDITSCRNLISNIARQSPEKILIIANDINTAIIVQHVKLLLPEVKLYGCEWALNNQLLEYGGEALEGMYFTVSIHFDLQSAEMKLFNARYKKYFNIYPDIATYFGYEAAKMLFYTMKKTKLKQELLKQQFSNIDGYTGLFGKIYFNQYGDIESNVMDLIIKNGEFIIESTKEN